MIIDTEDGRLTLDYSKWDDECMNILVEDTGGVGDFCIHKDSIPEIIDFLTILHDNIGKPR